jgi:hypothetical protein
MLPGDFPQGRAVDYPQADVAVVGGITGWWKVGLCKASTFLFPSLPSRHAFSCLFNNACPILVCHHV